MGLAVAPFPIFSLLLAMSEDLTISVNSSVVTDQTRQKEEGDIAFGIEKLTLQLDGTDSDLLQRCPSNTLNLMHKSLYKFKKIVKVLSLRELSVALYHSNSISSSKNVIFILKMTCNLKV